MTLTSTLRAWLAPALLAAAVPPASTPLRAADVQVNKPGVKISPTSYGLMTEEINHAYDGGLYGELIQNRAFKDDPKGPAHWSVVTSGGGAGTITLDTANPVAGTALTNCLRLDIPPPRRASGSGPPTTATGASPFKPNTTYRASFYAKAGPTLHRAADRGHRKQRRRDRPAPRPRCPRSRADWKQYTVTLTTGNVTPSTANRFVISASSRARSG